VEKKLWQKIVAVNDNQMVKIFSPLINKSLTAKNWSNQASEKF
jgi:hypothetical protein